MKLSIIIPAYNEAETLPLVIKELKELSLYHEIIVVDDASTDSTRDYLQQIEDDSIRWISNGTNRGKGYSVRQGLRQATGDIIAIQDGDCEYDPRDLIELLKPFEEGALVVYGSRIKKRNNGMSYLRYYLGGRFLTLITNILFNSNITDEPTGYKLFRKEVLDSMDLQCEGFEFCPEVTGKILKQGIPIIERPISYNPRSFNEGKKIHWRDGFIAIFTLAKIRFFYKPSLKN